MQAYDLSKLSILVLEKHILVRKLLTDVFREFGVPTVMSTAEPDEAYKMFEQFPVDLILSDWTPDLDGMAFLKNVRQNPTSPNPFVPLIVVTASTELGHVITARDMGMTEFLDKPVSAKLVYSRIVSCIENHRQFIRINDFFGPDRRRRRNQIHSGSERRRVS